MDIRKIILRSNKTYNNMSELTDESIMTFGKFKDQKLANIPSWWLLWWYNENKPLFDYIEDNMEVLEKEQ